MIYPPFSLPHILYLLISAALAVMGCRVMYSQKVSDCQKDRIIRICAAIMPFLVLLAQYHDVKESIALGEANAWINILPNSYCTFVCLFIGIFILLGKTDGYAMHFLAYHALIGCLSSSIYPNYFNSWPFFAPETLASMSVHVLSIWIVIALIITGKFRPTYKKFWCYPVGFTIAAAFGAFEIYVLGSKDAMNVTKPVIPGVPFAYWYVLMAACSIGVLLLTGLLSKIRPFKRENPETAIPN